MLGMLVPIIDIRNQFESSTHNRRKHSPCNIWLKFSFPVVPVPKDIISQLQLHDSHLVLFLDVMVIKQGLIYASHISNKSA